MTNSKISNAFILTGDEPIQAKTLKRLLLTYNIVYFSDVSDEAIINDNEVVEIFPGSRISRVWWAACGHYPRITDFEERYFRCIKGAETAINRKILQPISSKNIKSIDPGIHWMTYGASVSNAELINAAAVDATKEKPHVPVPATILSGMGIAPSGMKSKYSVDFKDSANILDVHEDWNWICKLRVGRALKTIRIAQALGASPVSVDAINSSISLSLIHQNTPFTFSESEIVDYSIDAEVIDNERLEEILSDAPWEDVLKIRKETLPAISKTRKYLLEKTNSISNKNISTVEKYEKEIRELKSTLDNLKEEEVDAWESLRIGAVLKAGGATGMIGVGSYAFPTLVAFPSILISVISGGLVSAASLTPELQKLIPARRKLRDHPLFILEKIQNK